jgi:long-chain acyl-CoA synthetase
MRGAKACFPALLAKGEKLLVFLPLAHVLARAITIAAFANKVTLGFTSDIKNLVPTLGVFKPTLVVSVPRVFEKVYNTAEQNARNDGKGRIFEIAANTAIEWSQAQESGGQERSDSGKRSGGPGLLLRAKHAVFDRLVYGKLRAALGGNCHAAISGGAPLGARLGHFYRGVGLTIYEGYGLTETSAAITVNRVGDVKVGSVGKLLPGNSMRINDDGELLVSGGVVFSGYWHNEEETKAVISDGWFHTGDLGAIDDAGFLTIVGRKKEIIVTAGGKNVAPALLEDRLRAHPLISQAMAVGDAQPFIAALITIDPEAFPAWKSRNAKDAGASVGELADDPDLLAEIDLAVKEANTAVSKAEAIRKFRILPVDFTEDTGELTPTLKVKRKVVAEKFASDIDALYAKVAG